MLKVIILSMAMMSSVETEALNQPQVAILPDEMEIPQGRPKIKKTRGRKGRGNTPYYAKYFR